MPIDVLRLRRGRLHEPWLLAGAHLLEVRPEAVVPVLRGDERSGVGNVSEVGVMFIAVGFGIAAIIIQKIGDRR